MRFVRPETLAEAVDLLARDPDGTKIIAGGTAVVLMMQHGLIAPEVLVSLGRLPDMDAITVTEGGLHIGALALLREVATSPVVGEQVPALARACGLVGNVRVRNQATLGGNLAEADYASDPPAVLLALDAQVEAAGPGGSRRIPVNEFFQGFYTTALQPDEIITAILIPSIPAQARMTYLKYRSRSSEDRPCVGVAAVGTFDEDRCADLRIAVGAACEIPHRLSDVEAMSKDQPLSDELIREIAEGYVAGIDTLDDLRGSAWYRREMIDVHVRRALEELRDGRR